MLTPTPMLRPSPLDISGLFAGTFEALKRRFGLFIVIALFPAALAFIFVGVGVAIIIPAAVVAGQGSSRSLPGALIAGILVLLLGTLVAFLAQLKGQAMTNLGAYEIAQGERPDFRGLFSRTRGFLPRMVPVIAIAVGAVIVFYLLVGLLVAGSIGTMIAAPNSDSGAAAAAGLLGLVFLMFLFLIPVGLFLQTKLLYTVPAVAIEQTGGIDGLKRSWRLTSGAFWRTLGYYLVASIAVAVISYAVGFVSQLALLPVTAGLNQTSDPRQATAAMLAMLPVFLLVIALQFVVQVLTAPFLYIYTTYMFIDQVRRSEMPPAPAWQAGAPGPYPPQPGPYPPQQPGPYTSPQQPGQGYPPPPPQNPPPQNPPQGGWQPPASG